MEKCRIVIILKKSLVDPLALNSSFLVVIVVMLAKEARVLCCSVVQINRKQKSVLQFSQIWG